MALELVKLDSATLPGIADAIRAKSGGTALLLPSEMAAAIRGIKNLRVETGTITPAEDTKVITIPCADGAKAYILEATDDTISAIEGQSLIYVVVSAGNFMIKQDKSSVNAVMHVWFKNQYANGGITAGNSGGVTLSLNYNFYPGTYRWAAYYWEDDA